LSLGYFNLLSCLCGSERFWTIESNHVVLLSCLCGSELILKNFKASCIAAYRAFD
jgi:hypothetical protein